MIGLLDPKLNHKQDEAGMAAPLTLGLAPDVREELQIVAGGDPFAHIEWFEMLAATTFDTRDQFFCLIAGEGTNLTCLPLRSPGKRTLRALSNFYSPLFNPVGASPDLADLAQKITRWLRADSRQWDVVDLSPLDPASEFFSKMRDAFRQAGFLVDDYFCFGNWYVPAAGLSYERYLAGRSSLTRNNIARAHRRMARAGGMEVCIIESDCPALVEALEQYHTVYNRSWKRPEPYPEFIPAMCRFAARHGWLRLGLLRMEERPIAAQIWLVADGRAMIYKLAYESASARFGAGTLLTAHMMKHVLDFDRVEEIDYLVGDDPYKREWMTHRRERRGIVAFNPRTARGLAGAIKHFAGRLSSSIRTPRGQHPPGGPDGPAP